MKKRLLALFVGLVMLLQVFCLNIVPPYTVFADESANAIQYIDRNSVTNPDNRYLEASTKDKANNVLLPLDMVAEEDTAIDTKLPERQLLRSKATQRTYSFDELNAMDYQTLIQTITSIKWNQIPGLFSKSAGSIEFFGNSQRVQAIINALYSRGSQFTANDHKGIPTLVEVLRAGYYLAFYNSELSYLNTRVEQDKCIPAMKQITANPYFSLGTETQNEVVGAVGSLIGNASCDAQLITSLTPVMVQFNQDFLGNCEALSKSKAIYSLLRGIQYDLNSYINNEDKNVDPQNTKWGRKIDGFINETAKMSLETTINENTGWLINNAIFTIATIGKFHTNPQKGQATLTTALNVHEYLGEQYFEAVNGINKEYNGIDSNGNTLNMEQIKNDGRNKYYPNTYKFDNEKMIIKTGQDVTEEKVKRLYWAAKEVSSQYFIHIERDQALEPNNADKVLTIIIYNNPKEYKMNYALNDISTDNGGMYIEGDGTFYTYERTPEQSIYTLEELFRHEYTHYLQGRYLVPGLWGGNMHENDRLTWFEEGEAEFYAGSTDKENIKTRKSMVSNILRVPAEQRYSAQQTMSASYNDGFGFYPYSCFLINYLIKNDYEKYVRLKNYLINNNPQGYDQYIQSLKNDYTFNQNYQQFMQQLVDNYDSLITPLVSDDYLAEYPNKSLSEVKSDIESLGITNVTGEEQGSQFFNTFEIKGTYTGEYYSGELSDIQKMKTVANNFLTELEQNSWGGYKTTTCYFLNWRRDNQNRYQFDIVFRGYLNDGTGSQEPSTPIVKINGPYEGETGNPVTFSSLGTQSTNGSIVKYEWSFGDGGTSTEANPTHTYVNKGIYTISLKVIDSIGKEAIKTTTANITDGSSNNDFITKETEPNNEYAQANGPMKSGINVNSALENADKDFFYFSVDKPTKVKISLNKISGSSFTYLLFKESNLNSYISYPKYVEGSLSYSEETLDPGKYYIYIYTWGNQAATYDIKWEAADSTDPDPIKPEVNINGPYEGFVGEEVNLSSEGSKAINGNIIAYEWNFGDQTTSNEKNPSHIYNTAGVFEVSLLIRDSNGQSNSQKTTVKIELPPIAAESEPNDSFDQANGPVKSLKSVRGSIEGGDVDIYYFDITDTSNIKIKITELEGSNLTYVLFRENAFDQYLSWPKYTDGNTRFSEESLNPGRYYIYIYSGYGTSGNYDISWETAP